MCSVQKYIHYTQRSFSKYNICFCHFNSSFQIFSLKHIMMYICDNDEVNQQFECYFYCGKFTWDLGKWNRIPSLKRFNLKVTPKNLNHKPQFLWKQRAKVFRYIDFAAEWVPYLRAFCDKRHIELPIFKKNHKTYSVHIYTIL